MMPRNIFPVQPFMSPSEQEKVILLKTDLNPLVQQLRQRQNESNSKASVETQSTGSQVAPARPSQYPESDCYGLKDLPDFETYSKGKST